MPAEATKKVFISYSWAVQERVIELAERLFANGVSAVLDVYDLKEGQDKYAFMEQSVTALDIDRVLIICDKTYAEKANTRSGGVGDETVIISPEIYGQIRQEKFIPIIFEVDEDGKAFCPTYIKSRIYIDLSTEDDRYESEYEKLLRNIFEKPIYKKPALGTKPEWLENDTIDLSAIRDIIKQVRGYTGGNAAKADFLLRKAADEFIGAAKQYTIQENTSKEDGILPLIDQFKSYRDLFVDYLESIIYSGFSLANIVPTLIERLYNELHDATEKTSYSHSDFEVSDFFIWELFIVMTATCLHFDKFFELRSILEHTYFLKESYFSNSLKAHNFSQFRAYCQTIEVTCKSKSATPNLHTMMGDILVKREKKPILTKDSLSNADIVLYQLFEIMSFTTEGHDGWFPLSYIYHEDTQIIWQKLKSTQYCKLIMPLFGVTTIDKLREVIANSHVDRDMRHRSAWEPAPCILSSIKLEEIGSTV
ncbi:MAG: toll/interleukin-1 receptor domain-containing protein [Christensenellaceae bacterium]